eukprot:TRINITY_DN25090_c0_g1_i1.p1 TRINITY_DN25090_c0_g1~~TRINITY_DN25090_c0_g1_i1.p1  ORF type:complete len:828 (+),score=136.34 TRINITY_DN25090_c0_g1_i1:159-2642(+)
MPGTVLKVHILDAFDLPDSPEPVVACLSSSRADPEFVTKASEQSCNAVWNEEHEIRHYKPGDALIFRVLSQSPDDSLGTFKLQSADSFEDLLGEVCIDSQEFYPQGLEAELPLENVPHGRAAILRVCIDIDDGTRLPVVSKNLPPSDTLSMDALPPSAMLPQRFIPEADSTPVEGHGRHGHHGHHGQRGQHGQHGQNGHHGHRGHDRETRGGSSSSTASPEKKFSSAVRRMTVTVVGADRLLDLTGSERCNSYCVCEVQGKMHSKFQTVVADSPEPVWNKKVDFDYAPGEPLLFSLYHKEVWPKRDCLLATAVLHPEDMGPRGFDGELPLDSRQAPVHGPTLRVQVSFDGKAPAAPACHAQAHATHGPVRGESRHRKLQDGEEQRTARETPSRMTDVSQSLHGLPKVGLHESRDTKRLRVCIQSFRGLHGSEAAGRRGFSCSCSIAGCAPELQTALMTENGFQTVWNFEGEIVDYMEGEDLDFHVVSQGGELQGSCVVRSEQFYPFGFNSDLTLFSPGQGILGLLRIRIVVPKEEGRKVPAPLGLRTVGLDQWSASGTTSGTRTVNLSGESHALRSHHALESHDASRTVIQPGTSRHRLSPESSAVVRPTSNHAIGLLGNQHATVVHASSPPAERAESWRVPAPMTAAACAPTVTTERGGMLLRGAARLVSPRAGATTQHVGPIVTTSHATPVMMTSSGMPTLSAMPGTSGAAVSSYVPAAVSTPCYQATSYLPPPPAATGHTLTGPTTIVTPGLHTATFGGGAGYPVTMGQVGGQPDVPSSVSAGALSLLAEARSGFHGGGREIMSMPGQNNREILSIPGVLPPAM